MHIILSKNSNQKHNQYAYYFQYKNVLNWKQSINANLSLIFYAGHYIYTEATGAQPNDTYRIGSFYINSTLSGCEVLRVSLYSAE